MGYQVLARKWRPKTFDELAGQEHVLKALVNALENQRLHHAYLFTGTRGVGKTTIARILARSLNCETGITASPCGTCSACQEINDGRFIDLIEVDAASRTKVEDTRDLLENIQYRPTRGRYKIYLIDEVHMLSTHSFNALLKTLEEPPEHVKFLLATTDPQKLPVTVLSRCLQFNLKNITAARIQEYLQFVLGEEKIPSEAEALWHLARAARGSMRDALSLTDQAISHGGGKLSETDVVTMLGTVDRKRIYELMDGLVAGDVKKVLQIAESLAEFSPDYFALVEDMLVMMHAIAVYQQVPDAQRSEGFESEKLASYAQSFTPEDVQLIYQMLLMGSKDLQITPDLHMGFEMLLLRLIAFQPAKNGEVLVDESVGVSVDSSVTTSGSIGDEEGTPEKKFETASIEHRRLAIDSAVPTSEEDQRHTPENETKPDVENNKFETTDNTEQAAIAKEVSAEIGKEANSALVRDTNAESGKETNTAITQELLDESIDEPPAYTEVPAYVDELVDDDLSNSRDFSAEVQEKQFGNIELVKPASENGLSSGQEEKQLNQIGVALENLDDDDAGLPPKKIAELNSENWIALFRNLPLKGMVKTLCAHLVVEENTAEGVRLNLAEAGQKIFEQSHHDKFNQALADYFGEPVQIFINMGGVGSETPAEYADRRYQEKLIVAEQSILGSPVVQKLVEEFDAQLVPGSVYLNTPKT